MDVKKQTVQNSLIFCLMLGFLKKIPTDNFFHTIRILEVRKYYAISEFLTLYPNQGSEKKILEKSCLKRLKHLIFKTRSTLDLSQICLTLNVLKTEFTAVSEDRKQVCWLSQFRVDSVFNYGRSPGC